MRNSSFSRFPLSIQISLFFDEKAVLFILPGVTHPTPPQMFSICFPFFIIILYFIIPLSLYLILYHIRYHMLYISKYSFIFKSF